MEESTAGIAGGRGAARISPLEGLTTTTEECAEDVDRESGAPCSSDRVVSSIMEFAVESGRRSGSPSAAVRSAAAALGCGSESCVIVHPIFRRFVAKKKLLSASDLDGELDARFKAPGPRESTALLSNYNIDETLGRWARVFPSFFPCPFAMMDFDRTGERFATIDLVDVLEGREPVGLGPGAGRVERPCACFGCVVNTDVSSGPGKHWVAVFVDCRPRETWSVEYFNSAGRPPPKAMVRWMERSCARLAAYHSPNEVVAVPVTDVDHQKSQTECGLYALFYIRRRLEGTPYQFFRENLIPDHAMVEFRRHCFRSQE